MLRHSLELTAGVLACLLFVSQNTANHAASNETPHHVRIQQIPARPDDVATLDGIMKAYYEIVSGPAGQPRQWDRDHTLHIPEVRFLIMDEDANGNIHTRSMNEQEYDDAGDAALGHNAFYEHEIHRITHRFGNVAHILSTAEQSESLNGPATSHSIDSLEVFWDGHRWWIVNANIWPGDRPGRPLSKEFLP